MPREKMCYQRLRPDNLSPRCVEGAELSAGRLNDRSATAFKDPLMPFAHVNNIRMHYETHGHGEPLVLIEGLGSDHTGLLSLQVIRPKDLILDIAFV